MEVVVIVSSSPSSFALHLSILPSVVMIHLSMFITVIVVDVISSLLLVGTTHQVIVNVTECCVGRDDSPGHRECD